MAENDTTRRSVRPRTILSPATLLSDAEIAVELAWLEREWGELRAALRESGGMSGSPGEWIVERMDELETETKRRGDAPPAGRTLQRDARDILADYGDQHGQ